jgi:alpha-N-acetylglucosamine transferase
MKRLLKPNGYWTKERCIEDALNYKTRKEWTKQNSGAYDSAYSNNWLDECCNHMTQFRKSNGYWTKEKCLEEALKYNTIKEWLLNSKNSYQAAHKNKWLEECCKHVKTK